MSLWSKVSSLFGASPDVSPAQAPVAQVSRTPQEVFAEQFEAALRKTPGVTGFSRHPTEYRYIVRRGKNENISFLNNIFVETRDLSPAERQARIERFIQGFFLDSPSDDSWDAARSNLVPVLRAGSVYTSMHNRLEAEARPIAREFLPFLLEGVGYDRPTTTQYLNGKMVSDWKMDVSAVFDAATENAKGYLSDPEHVESYDEGAPYPIWHVARDDDYESSRLLVPGWLAGFAGRVKGRPVSIVPARSTCIVGGDGDEACLRRLIETAQKSFEASPWRISPALYTVDGAGTVIPLLLPEGHPLAGDVAVGHAKLAVFEYSSQKEALDGQAAEDVFVATYRATQHETTGAVTSHCVWTRDVPSLLPKADMIIFVPDPEGKTTKPFAVAWNAVAEIVGDRLRLEPELYPPRWRTGDWPDEPMVGKLKAQAEMASGG